MKVWHITSYQGYQAILKSGNIVLGFNIACAKRFAHFLNIPYCPRAHYILGRDRNMVLELEIPEDTVLLPDPARDNPGTWVVSEKQVPVIITNFKKLGKPKQGDYIPSTRVWKLERTYKQCLWNTVNPNTLYNIVIMDNGKVWKTYESMTIREKRACDLLIALDLINVFGVEKYREDHGY